MSATSDFTSLIASLSALASALAAWAAITTSAKIQLKTIERQFAANISSKRQDWINELRKDFAEYLRLMTDVEALIHTKAPKDFGQRNEIYKSTLSRAHELSIRIRLRLNKNESDHTQLWKLILELEKACKYPNGNQSEQESDIQIEAFRSVRENLIANIQAVLKKEWERVKVG